MVEVIPNRSSPEYIRALIATKPLAGDPKDIRIKRLIEQNFLQEEWAKTAFKDIRSEQIGYLKDAIAHVNSPDYVKKITQQVVERISAGLKTTIEEGQDLLAGVPKGSPVLVMTNHLGTYKLAGINPQTELNLVTHVYEGYDLLYPFPLYFACLRPVAQQLGDELSYTSDDYPGIYGRLHTIAGFIHVPPTCPQNGRIVVLKNQTAELVNSRPHTAVINFPEGGTSGKYNQAGPYDLRQFKTGGYVIAAELGLHVVTVGQYFDPQKGMKLKVFEAFRPEPSNREDYQMMAAVSQQHVQEWLNAKQANT